MKFLGQKKAQLVIETIGPRLAEIGKQNTVSCVSFFADDYLLCAVVKYPPVGLRWFCW